VEAKVANLPMTKFPMTVAILAGGKSSRMGQNKAFLAHHQTTFLESLCAEFAEFQEVLVSVKATAHFPLQDVKLVADDPKLGDIGPMNGLLTSLTESQFADVFVCATDMPNLTSALVRVLASYRTPDYQAIVLTEKGRLQPLCALYNKRALPVLKTQLNQQKYRLKELLAQLQVIEVPLEQTGFNHAIIQNINTPSEYRRLLPPPVLCITGVKNSGKTTFITKLIPLLKAQEITVGVIKHDGHEFTADVPGTDTFKYRQSGATETLVYSKTQVALVKKRQQLTEAALFAEFSEVDLILVEGLKQTDYPKVELVRAGNSTALVSNVSHLLAVISDFPFKAAGLPTLPLNEPEKLIPFIKNEVLAHARFISKND
jgi:molybdopterin-guanine dinucleotide biosynthesis protein MobB